jgi:NAD(P)-dependent dehydrogenase (short-subunit alcohol dehydrogenase family)
MFDRQKETALVTGASSGMGKAIALQLIADGFQVYAAARQVDKMKDLAQLGAKILRMDVSREEEIGAAIDTILSEVDAVDVLVNNAGFGLFGPVEDIDLSEARYQFEVNLFGAARVTQLLLPAMRKKAAGTIVNVTSMGGKIYTPLGAWYHATKHALEGWSDCLRLELAEFGIRVVVIEPGIIETGFGDVAAKGLLERSARGPYRDIAVAVTEATRKSYGQGTGTDPGVIARIVSKAVRAKRPKTRYVAGKFAWPLIAIRQWFGDRAFDRVIMSQLSG